MALNANVIPTTITKILITDPFICVIRLFHGYLPETAHLKPPSSKLLDLGSRRSVNLNRDQYRKDNADSQMRFVSQIATGTVTLKLSNQPGRYL
jgi:hypothetical protein